MLKTKIKLDIHPMQLCFAIVLMMLPMTIIFQKYTGINAFDYLDELWSIFCVVYVFITLIRRNIKRNDVIFIVLVLICAFFGVMGNIMYNVIDDWFSIAVDMLCLFKVFFPFIVMKYIGQKDKDLYIARYMLPFAKILIIISTIFGFLTQLGYTDMYLGDERYGMKPYYFIFDSEPRFGYIIACCMLVVLLIEKNRTKENIYTLLGIINLVFTTKGAVYVIIVCYIGFLILWRKTNKMTPVQAAPLGVAGAVVSMFQIRTYLSNAETPRMLFLKYGFVTANNYFPLGSGFATYGSDMAGRLYSQLYYRYGFHKIYGLNPRQRFFITDCYYAMIFGQFGYIGAAIFIILMVIMFLQINSINIPKKAKAFTLAMFIGLIISGLGSALIKMNIGVLAMSMIGLICGYSKHNYEKEYTGSTLNIHI